MDDLRISYVVSGSQKAGTTSLALMLRDHPQIAPSPRKEWHYFDVERRPWADLAAAGFPDYRVARTDARQVIAGDATPLYLWWPQAMERLHHYDASMRHLILVRDPIERLVSQWQMVSNRWASFVDGWTEFITRFAPSGLEERIPVGINPHTYRMQSGIVRGYYGAQLARAVEMFGRERVLVLDFATFVANHATALDQVTDHLGIERFAGVPDLPHGMPGKLAASDDVPSVADVAGLVETYAQDLALFERLSGLDVAHWPTRAVLDGRLSLEEFTQRLQRRFARAAAPSAAAPVGAARRG